mgnify:CR=1 FL=1|jgi:hypothetical protein
MVFFEPIFHVFYLTSVFYMSIKMLKTSKNKKMVKLFGLMGLTLAAGDSFHLIPRIYALLTTGLEAHSVSLGIGKLITSLTMTLFYAFLFRIWELRFELKEEHSPRVFTGILVAARIILCLMPQNQWTLSDAPISWGIYRNIPFTILGALLVYLIVRKATQYKDKIFKKIGIAIIISFACYLPVVLFATTNRVVGMLMIPKTLAYLWIVYTGYKELR